MTRAARRPVHGAPEADDAPALEELRRLVEERWRRVFGPVSRARPRTRTPTPLALLPDLAPLEPPAALPAAGEPDGPAPHA